MKYTINKLAKYSGVSVRTLHHYDSIGLLTPVRSEDNGYRLYSDTDLLRLQQILIYRELAVPLDTIKRILDEPYFDYLSALEKHKINLLKEKNRLDQLVVTINKTINKLKKGETMQADDMYGGLTKKQFEEYGKEAQRRWGDTEAYRQSQINVKKLGKDGMKKVFAESQAIVGELVSLMDHDPGSAEVQRVVAKHRANISTFFPVNDEMYAGFAHMYIDDARFTATYDKAAPGLAQFLSSAMLKSVGK